MTAVISAARVKMISAVMISAAGGRPRGAAGAGPEAPRGGAGAGGARHPVVEFVLGQPPLGETGAQYAHGPLAVRAGREPGGVDACDSDPRTPKSPEAFGHGRLRRECLSWTVCHVSLLRTLLTECKTFEARQKCQSCLRRGAAVMSWSARCRACCSPCRSARATAGGRWCRSCRS